MNQRICIIGLGYVGLPTALLLASRGCRVHGVDLDAAVVERVLQGSIGVEPGLAELWVIATTRGLLTASRSPETAEVYIVAVPTPLGAGNLPDLSHVEAAIGALAPCLAGDELVCIESTCPVGTTEAMAALLPRGVQVAYCPERLLPGHILEEIVTNDRVVGGVTPEATERAVTFYRSFVKGDIIGTNARTAELVKLGENTYRDVNIAFANELSMLAERVGVDAHRVIELANRHPRVNILAPGIGVGGHCIAVDPWFFVAAAPDVVRLAVAAREVNSAKTTWIVEHIRAAIPPSAVVACLGLTYKADVDDTRESPALAIVQRLSTERTVLVADPHLMGTTNVLEAIEHANAVVVLVGHQSFRAIPREMLAGKIVLDFAGVLT